MLTIIISMTALAEMNDSLCFIVLIGHTELEHIHSLVMSAGAPFCILFSWFSIQVGHW